MQRSLRRIKHRIKRLVTSYVSPLGWAVTGLAIASLIAFTILSWHELLTMAIVFACMMVAAIMLSLGNTSFTATIDVSSRRVTVSDTVKVDVCVDNPGARQPHQHAATCPSETATNDSPSPCSPPANHAKPPWNSPPSPARYCRSAPCPYAKATHSDSYDTKRNLSTKSTCSSTRKPLC